MCDQLRMIQRKGLLSQLQLEEINRLVESSENNVEAQPDVQNQTGTEPIQKVKERHIAQNKEGEGRDEENSKLLINYNNIDIVEKQIILEKIVEIMKNNNLQNPQNLRRIEK